MMSPDPPLSLADAERVAAIVLAAGASARMGFDKLWAQLGGLPLVAWSIRAVARSEGVHDLVVAAPKGGEARMRDLLGELGVRGEVVAGGEMRQDSVRAALEACSTAHWVLVHDAARPLVTPELIARGLAEARETGAAIAAVPVTDTIKMVDGAAITGTPARDSLWAAQTPQVFRRDLLVAAHREAVGTASDDAALVERLGVRVRVYPGAYGNIKVTTPVDLQIAAALLNAARGHDEPATTERKDSNGGAIPRRAHPGHSRRDRL